jgi:hypothetical protein
MEFPEDTNTIGFGGTMTSSEAFIVSAFNKLTFLHKKPKRRIIKCVLF